MSFLCCQGSVSAFYLSSADVLSILHWGRQSRWKVSFSGLNWRRDWWSWDSRLTKCNNQLNKESNKSTYYLSKHFIFSWRKNIHTHTYRQQNTQSFSVIDWFFPPANWSLISQKKKHQKKKTVFSESRLM